MTNNFNKAPKKSNLTPKKYAYLKAEAQAPYKGLRKFIYFGIGASGAIGAFIFFIQILAQKTTSETIGNFFIQIAVISLMVFLYRLEDWKKTDKN